MEEKATFLSEAEVAMWIEKANDAAKSKCPHDLALKQFNALGAKNRRKVRERLAACEVIRKERVPQGEDSQAWRLGVMVDAQMVAREFHIDPLTAMLCVDPPGGNDQQVEVK